jgi:hypothetical protein
MHSDFGSSSGTEFGPGSNIKLEANFLGNKADSSIEKAIFYKFFVNGKLS